MKADKDVVSPDSCVQSAEEYIKARWEGFPEQVKGLSRYTEFAMGMEIGLRFEYWLERNNVLEKYIQRIARQNRVFCALLEDLIPNEEELDKRLKEKKEELVNCDGNT